MARRAGEKGQSTPEYVGLVLLAALAAMAFAGLAPQLDLARALEAALCRAVGAGCGGAGGTALPNPATDPRLLPAERERLVSGDPEGASDAAASLTPSELAWLELNDPPAFRGALGAIAWSEQIAALDMALTAELDDFLEYKRDPDHDPRLDYTDDACSAPVVGSKGPFWNFTEACYRHDFGYRNAKRLGVFDRYKARIDLVFARDMMDHCESRRLAERQCRTMALAYFQGVDKLGGWCELPGEMGRIPGPCAPEHG